MKPKLEILSVLLVALILTEPVRGQVVVPGAALRDAVHQQIIAVTRQVWPEVGVEFRREMADLPLRGKRYGLRVEIPGGPRIRGLVNIPVSVVVDGIVERTVVVSCLVRTYGDVFVVGQQVDRHQQVDSAEVDLVRRETTMLPEDVVLNHDDLRGKRTRRILQAGTVLSSSLLEPVPAVRQGDPVTLRVQTRCVVMSVKAKALEDGCLGSLIAVQRDGVREKLTGRVVDVRTVEMLVQ